MVARAAFAVPLVGARSCFDQPTDRRELSSVVRTAGL